MRVARQTEGKKGETERVGGVERVGKPIVSFVPIRRMLRDVM